MCIYLFILTRLRGGEPLNEKEEENYIYVDQLTESSRKKRRLDPYELPEMKQDELNSRLHKLDPRFVTTEEMQSFVNEFDLSGLDIDSEAFHALPTEIQYEIIQERTWKSRTTSAARLDEMVRGSKTALDFSKQQIKQLQYRNEMRQRLLNVNNASNGISVEPVRIASERGREYILYKNENIDEGLGWKLPGLSASNPVDLDPVPSHSEPKLEIPKDKQEENMPLDESNDKVAAAIASNPKLAALVEQFLSSDEEEEDEKRNKDIMNEKEDMDDDDEPLFMEGKKDRTSSHVINEYVHDDDNDAAIQQVISRIYGNENEPSDKEKLLKEKESIELLGAEDFYELWLSRVPDAFIYLYSFNNEYKNILRRAIEQLDMESLLKELQSVRKQFGKTNEGDELTLESLQFLEGFYESVVKWKLNQDEEEVFVDVSSKEIEEDMHIRTPSEPVREDQDVIMLDDEEDEEDIQFVETVNETYDGAVASNTDDNKGSFNDEVIVHEMNKEDVREGEAVDKSTNDHHVHININQSSLQLGNTELSSHFTDYKDDTPSLQSEKDTSVIVEGELKSANKEKEGLLKMNDKRVEENETMTMVDHSVQATTDTHGYNSEEELDGNVEAEEDEYARFLSDIALKKLDDIKNELYQDMKKLNKQQRKEMGNSDDITDQMVQDIQELLKLFGIPYVVSPMEAEAQCAELEKLNLVDGTITDDSDVFLFGATRVYKNMFNQQRYVECYQRQDIEREMLLTRKKLIQLAFLLGSDYTEGIPGVGPVAAMEILAEFSGSQDEEEKLELPLQRFKDWYNSGKDDTPFQKKFRKRHHSLDISDDFPNLIVIDAYYNPTVDHSSQKFEWGHPQLDSLRIFLMEAFGWPEEKADQVLLPVLREMNKKKVSFFL
ncbi:uncharacterized protein BX663DRAFT_442633 [Cokeromyces recurvatus]|uniref:uncharacterized protein n=1 Tax=Cokeromyces recurvatus TaxID=90255 RepID=UPI0022205487|nr:uncharacterized protein BX663DRAFT_442633 [Cokeromyces recurvatus]KAI7898658.1 hypothetical protein BX663DRAFT_442633 [Cokeromyces recurvatus]